MSIIYINPFQFAAAPPSDYDPDAQAYITAVETADGQALETGVRDAINAFVVGCKSDGIWSAIKASCIMAGARTLAGALVPLVGAAPTNVGGNFVAADYNRKTGLKADGSTKYLDSNRDNIDDPQDDNHLSMYISEANTIDGRFYAGAGASTGAVTNFAYFAGGGGLHTRNKAQTATYGLSATQPTGFLGMSRASSSAYTRRVVGTTSTATVSSTTPGSLNHYIYRTNNSQGINARLSFYSIGESLDLALLDARVSTLMSDLAAAIP